MSNSSTVTLSESCLKLAAVVSGEGTLRTLFSSKKTLPSLSFTTVAKTYIDEVPFYTGSGNPGLCCSSIIDFNIL